jgi:hypothetical protein
MTRLPKRQATIAMNGSGMALTRGVAVVERAREAQVGEVEKLAQARLDVDAHPCGRVAAPVVDRPADRREHEDDPELGPQRPHVPQDRVVDRARHQDGDGDRERAVDEGVAQAERAQPPLLAPDLQEPSRGRAQVVVGGVVDLPNPDDAGRAC